MSAITLGFFYALSAVALKTEADIAEWLIDLLIKLGREDDAYDAVALVLPDLARAQEPPDPEPEEDAGPIEAGATVSLTPVPTEDATVDLSEVTAVPLHREGVPAALDPGRFFEVMIGRVLDNSPINFHPEARKRRREALT